VAKLSRGLLSGVDGMAAHTRLLSSATYMRLVIEPRTLQFYESDIRRLSYSTIKGTKYYHLCSFSDIRTKG
jgi:hypothetical protein